MDIESVRSLKQEALETLIAPTIQEVRHASAFSVAAKSLNRTTSVMPAVALGISRGKNSKDFRLAVRVQVRPLDAHADLQARLRDLARGEVDIRYIGRVTKQQGTWNTSRQRPLLIGASVGHFAVTAGTIGGFPVHRKTGKRLLLSNNHVLANENRGKVGDAILQTGVLDGGVKGTDTVGTLLDFVPLKLSGTNLIDAAIATIDDTIDSDLTALTGAAAATLKGLRATPFDAGEQVFKLGRTTGLTSGKVTAIEVDDVVVDYEIGSLRFDRQVEVEGEGNTAFSDGGDSGSLIFDAQGNAGGLLFSGTDQGGSNGRGLTYISDLALVLDTLDARLDI